MDGHKSSVSTHETNIGGNRLELVLEGSDLGAHLELLDNFTEAGAVADHDADHLAFTLGAVGARHKNGGGKVVLARDFSDGSLVHVGLLLVLDTHASSEGFLLDFVGFTSHGGLVAKKLGRLQEDTIDGDSHTVVDHNDVTNVEMVVMDGLDLAGAQDIAL